MATAKATETKAPAKPFAQTGGSDGNGLDVGASPSQTATHGSAGAGVLGLEALGHVAAAMAHELRNALNSVAIHAELLESRMKKLSVGPSGVAPHVATDAGAPIARSLGVIRNEVRRADEIVEGYLQHVGPHEAARKTVSMTGVLAAAAAMAAERAQSRGVRIEVASGPTCTWSLDERALSLALNALVDNAVLASARGGVVRLSARDAEDSGVIEVEDRGCGIAPDAAAKIFGLGFSTWPGHAGLGLTVAKQAVKGQGGSLLIRSAGLGTGTVARIELPLDPIAPPGTEDQSDNGADNSAGDDASDE